MKKILTVLLGVLAAALLFWPSSARADYESIQGPYGPDNSGGGSSCSWHGDSQINCGDEMFWLDVDKTQQYGRLVYRWKTGNPADWTGKYLVLENIDTSARLFKKEYDFSQNSIIKKGTWEYILNNENRTTVRNFSPNSQDPCDTNDTGGCWRWNPDKGVDNSKLSADGKKMVIYTKTIDPTNINNYVQNTVRVDIASDGSFEYGGKTFHFYCGIDTKSGEKCYDGQDGRLRTIDETTAKAISDATAKTAVDASNTPCVNNPLSFFLCPVMSMLTDAVTGLSNFLVGLLKLPPLSQPNGVSGTQNNMSGLQDGFVSFRNIANGLYILIFLIIIFSNFFSVGLDNYSIKKMLPRLLAVAIITQFGYLLLSLVVDLSNVLLVAIPAAVNNGSTDLGGAIFANFQHTVSGTKNSAVGALNGIGYFLVMLILMAAILVVLLMSIGYLLFRIVFLVILVFISPVAFAGWILPQTQSLSKKWAMWFIKLCLMGPILGLILALTTVIQTIFTGMQGQSEIIDWASVFVPFFGVAMIPKAFKWSGDIMSQTGKAISGSAVGQMGKNMAKKSAQQGQLANLGGKALTNTFGRAPGRLGEKAAFAGMKKQSAYQARGREDYDKLNVDQLIKLKSSGKGNVSKQAGAALGKKEAEIMNQQIWGGASYESLNKIRASRGQGVVPLPPGTTYDSKKKNFNTPTGVEYTIKNPDYYRGGGAGGGGAGGGGAAGGGAGGGGAGPTGGAGGGAGGGRFPGP